jgi:hypothetical protein
LRLRPAQGHLVCCRVDPEKNLVSLDLDTVLVFALEQEAANLRSHLDVADPHDATRILGREGDLGGLRHDNADFGRRRRGRTRLRGRRAEPAEHEDIGAQSQRCTDRHNDEEALGHVTLRQWIFFDWR